MFTQLVLLILEHFNLVNFDTTKYAIYEHQQIKCDEIRLIIYWTQHNRNLTKTLNKF